MINFFLNQRQGLTERKRKIIEKKFLSRRKYNPFHLDCQYTKKKICYCKKNPITHLTEGQKAQLWRNSYMKPYQFYSKEKLPVKNCEMMNNQSFKSQQPLKNSKGKEQEEKQKKQIDNSNQKEVQQAARQLHICIQKIKALSKQEIVNFVKEHSKRYRRAIVQTADSAQMQNQY